MSIYEMVRNLLKICFRVMQTDGKGLLAAFSVQWRWQNHFNMNHKDINDKAAGGYLSAECKLLEPYSYINQLRGHQMPEKLAHVFNHWMRIPDDKYLAIRDIIQLFHNSSVMMDDIEDNSVLRRGSPAAHSVYGIPRTISAANYAMIAAEHKVLDLNHPDAMRICVEQLLLLHRGQGMELYWRDTYTCPSEEEYREIAAQKGGGLCMMLLKLMQLFSENKEDFTRLVDILGLYLQIQNDYYNLYFQDYAKTKGYCEDLTEGKFSFPIMHAIYSQPNDNQIISILCQRTNDPELKRYCVSLLECFGSFEYTQKVLTELEFELREEISKLCGNPVLEAMLDKNIIYKVDNDV